MNELPRMRLIERQQQILLEMRSAAAREERQAAGQGLPEGAPWLRDAKAEVQTEEEAGAQRRVWVETSWGWRLTRQVRV